MLAAMGYEISGKLHAIFDAQDITERFRKREFVLELAESRYPQYVKFELTGENCEALDAFSKGDEVEVEFRVGGREWTSPSGEVRYFNSLGVWKIEARGDAQPRDDEPPAPDEPPVFSDEPPF